MKPHLILLLVASVIQINGENTYTQRFLEQYNKIHDSNNGYFNSLGIPYHSVETLIVEAPDHGHESTSEAYSYYIYLEAMYGAISGDFSSFNTAWEIMEKYLIPTAADQPTNSFYTSTKSDTKGEDPLYEELKATYGDANIYAMHWLQDVDNVYGFGNIPGQCEAGPDAVGPSMINNFMSGSVWTTIPRPTCDDYKYGSATGFDLGDASYNKQWKFSVAPDADARAIQAAYWAYEWANAAGKLSDIKDTLEKAGKLGDYLRYAMFDQNFKKIGNCIGITTCESATGKDSAHYLLSWDYNWGGSLDTVNGWAWRSGDSHSAFAYQNPVAAYGLVNVEEMKPKSPTAVDDWKKSLQRQLELYQYLQSNEGPFANAVTNSYNNNYESPSGDVLSNTFYGMFYTDDGSDNWFGFQGWSTDRLAQYYYITGDEDVKELLDKWVEWFISNTKFDGDNFQIPASISWSGVPNAYTGTKSTNTNLHATVNSYSSDIGNAAPAARTLLYYAAKSGHTEAKETAKKLLDGMWTLYQDDLGLSVPESTSDYINFNAQVSVPNGWTGTYPNGDKIESGSTFISIRSWYKNDPDWPKVEAYLNGGEVPVFNYHRFWQQADIALALGAYGLLFDE